MTLDSLNAFTVTVTPQAFCGSIHQLNAIIITMSKRGVIDNFVLITFQISFELQLPKINIDTSNTAKWVVRFCYKCISFVTPISFYEKLNAT